MSLSIRSAKLALVILAMVFGTFEPAGHDPLWSGRPANPTHGAPRKSRPLVLRIGHNFSDNYATDDRLRKPSHSLCQIRLLEKAVCPRTAHVLKGMSSVVQMRRTSGTYPTKDHPAFSPSRWRC